MPAILEPSVARARVLTACLLAAALVATGVGAASAARDPAARDALKRLYRLALSADLCGFPVTDAQSSALGKEMDKFVHVLDLDEDASDELYQKVEAEMEKEGLAQICREDGAWAKTYRQEMEKMR